MPFRAFTHPMQALEGQVIDPPVEDFDHFTVGGFVRDDTLANESDPSAKFCTLADKGEWLVTLVEAGGGDASIVILDDEPGGVVRFLNDAGDNDTINAQMNGESYKVAAGLDVFYSIKMRVADFSETDWLVGLATTDTDVLTAVTEFIGFRDNSSTGNINAVVRDNSTETLVDTGVNLVDATFVTLAYRVISNVRVKFYVDGDFVTQISTNIPDGDAVTPTIQVRNDGAVAQSLDCDWHYVTQDLV